MRSDHSYRIEHVTTQAGLAPLQEPWEALLREMPAASVFATWEYASAWWQQRRPHERLWVLAVYDQSDGRLAGIAPWILSDQPWGPLRLRRLTFIGSPSGPPVHQDILARPDACEPVYAALQSYLARHRKAWDLLDLKGLPEASAIRKGLAPVSGRFVALEPDPAPYVLLPATWEEYERQQLSANRRQQMRKKQRTIEKDYPGQVTYEMVTEAAELAEAHDALARLSRQRWHDRGLASAFDDPYYTAFYREFSRLALARGWLRLYVLRVAGQILAVESCFRYGDRVYNVRRAFDRDWERYSPGLLLYAHVIGEAIREGACEFDMLPGLHDYKLSWSNAVRYDRRPVISGSWRGDLWLAAGMAFEKTRSVARRRLPPDVRQRVNRYVSALGS